MINVVFNKKHQFCDSNQELGQNLDRFIPKRTFGIGSYFLPTLGSDTKGARTVFEKILGHQSFGSEEPQKELILQIGLSCPLYPLNLPVQSADELKHGTLSASQKHELFTVGLMDDFYHQGIAYHPGHNCIAMAVGDQIYVMKQGELSSLKCRYFGTNQIHPTALLFNPQGNRLIVSCSSGNVVFMDLKWNQNKVQHAGYTKEMYKPSTTQSQASHVLCMVGSDLLIGTCSGLLYQRTSCGMQYAYEDQRPSKSRITGLISSPDETHVLVGDHDGFLHLVDIKKRQFLCSVRAFKKGTAVKAMSFSPCGKWIGVAGNKKDTRMMIYRLKSQRMVQEVEKQVHSQTVNMFWKGDLILSTHADGSVRSFRTRFSQVNGRLFLNGPVVHKTLSEGYPLTYAVLRKPSSIEKNTFPLTISCGHSQTVTQYIFEPFKRAKKESELDKKSTRLLQEKR